MGEWACPDRDRELHGKQAEQGGELDDRVEGHRGGVLERITHGVTNHRGIVQLCSLGVQIHLDDLLGVVPSATGVGHEDRLVQAEDGDRDEVADEEVGIDEGEGQGGEEHRQEDVDHALLGVLGADLHDAGRVLGGGLGGRGIQLHVGLDVLHGPVGAGGDGLHGGPGEPVDDGSTGDETQQERGMGEAELGHLGGVLQAIGEHHDDREDHRRRADDGRPDEHWLGGGLEGVSRPILSLQEVLGHLPPGSEAELGLHLLVDVWQLLDGRQLVDALGVVGDGSVGVDGNRHRAHAEETEGHQPEGEDGPLHLAHRAHVTQARSGSRDQKCGTHEGDDRHTQPVPGEVAGHQTRQDVQ